MPQQLRIGRTVASPHTHFIWSQNAKNNEPMAAPAPPVDARSSSASSKTLYTPSPASCARYHPSFASPDADVVLQSLEGTLYRVHSYTLRTTSGLFETMFLLPQPTSRQTTSLGEISVEVAGLSPRSTLNGADIIIPVFEPNLPLERLLRLICGLPIPKWDTCDEIESVLTVAEKWDTPGPIASIRAALTSPRFLEADPLRLYALARHFGWDDIAKLASTQTLKLDLHDPAYAPMLERLTSKDLLPLLSLRRKRRDKFVELLNSPERFTAGNSSPYHCIRCGVAQIDNHTWRELKNAMFLEMDRRPMGDTLAVLIGEAEEWPEAKACWEAKCQKEDCGGLNYDKIATLRQIKNCMDLLPLMIEA